MRRLTAADVADQRQSTSGVKPRACRRALLVGCVVGIAVVIGPASAQAHRLPTGPERTALTAALGHVEGVATKPASVVISTRAPGWAAVEWGSKPYELIVFHKIRSGWQPTGWTIDPSQPRDGLCAYVPATVVADLLALACPPYRALHARYASPALSATFTATLRTDPTTHFVLGGSPFRLISACVSRLDPTWAGGVLVLPDTSIIVWFHKQGSRWQPIYYKGQPRGTTLPSHAVNLSLARCVGADSKERPD